MFFESFLLKFISCVNCSQIFNWIASVFQELLWSIQGMQTTIKIDHNSVDNISMTNFTLHQFMQTGLKIKHNCTDKSRMTNVSLHQIFKYFSKTVNLKYKCMEGMQNIIVWTTFKYYFWFELAPNFVILLFLKLFWSIGVCE